MCCTTEFTKIGPSICFSFSIKFNQATEMLERFSKIDSSNTGQITLEQFASYLNLPVSDNVQALFELYDRVRD
jgi:Ca2+-binding EF-hand superfamily protein